MQRAAGLARAHHAHVVARKHLAARRQGIGERAAAANRLEQARDQPGQRRLIGERGEDHQRALQGQTGTEQGRDFAGKKRQIAPPDRPRAKYRALQQRAAIGGLRLVDPDRGVSHLMETLDNSRLVGPFELALDNFAALTDRFVTEQGHSTEVLYQGW